MSRVYVVAALMYLSLEVCGTVGSNARGDERARFPTVGIEVENPKGWPRQPRAKAQTIALWISPDSAPGDPAAVIMIDCGRSNGGSAEEIARSLARDYKGVVDDRTTTLGGTLAFRVVATNNTPKMAPIEAVVAMHDGYLYLLMGGAKAGHSVDKAIEAIRKSWRWIPIEPVTKHLKLGEQGYEILDRAARIQFPPLMHIYLTEHPEHVFDLGLHDFARNKTEFYAYVQLAPIPDGQSFDQIKKNVAEGFRTRFGVKGPIPWHERGGNPDRVVTPDFELEVALDPDAKKIPTTMKLALVKLDDRRFIAVNFTLDTSDPDERKAYSDLADRIADSIRAVDSAGQPQKPK